MNNDTIKQDILKKIEHISQTPTYVFWLRSCAVAALGTFALLMSIYILAFIVFMLSEKDIIYAPLFGVKGVQTLLISLPWTLLMLSLLALLIAGIVFRHFEFAYKRSVLGTILTVIVVIITTHILFIYTGIQKFVKEEAFKRGIPLAPEGLRQMRKDPPDRLFVGRVIGTSSESVTIQTRPGHIIEIYIATDTNGFTHSEINEIKIGQELKVLGERESRENSKPGKQREIIAKDILK